MKRYEKERKNIYFVNGTCVLRMYILCVGGFNVKEKKFFLVWVVQVQVTL